MNLVNTAVKNVGLTSYSLCNAEHIVCSCSNEWTKDFFAFSFEQINLFFRTIVVALYGQSDFFMEITLTELEFAEKKIDNIVFNDIGVF